MAVEYTEEQLNTVDKSLLIHLRLQQQEQLEALTKELCASNEKCSFGWKQLPDVISRYMPAKRMNVNAK